MSFSGSSTSGNRAGETARSKTRRGLVLEHLSRRRIGERALRRESLAGGGFARPNDAPIGFGKRASQRINEPSERLSFRNIADFDQKMDMIGHDGEGRDFLTTAPIQMKAPDNRGKGACDFVLDEPPLGRNGRKRLKPRKAFQGDHVIERRFVVESAQAHDGAD